MTSKQFLRIIYYKLWYILNYPALYLKKINHFRCLEISGLLYISNKGQISVGRGVRINSSPTSNPIGGGERTFIQVLDSGVLNIDDGVRMSNVAITVAKNVTIGKDTYIGAGVAIFDTDFHPLGYLDRINGIDGQIKTNVEKIAIGKGVFVGTRSVILKGVTIGDEAVIGAGSIVTKSIAAREIWAGNPAKKIGSIE